MILIQVCYIEPLDSSENKKIIYILKKILGVISVKKRNDSIELVIPRYNSIAEKLYNKKIYKNLIDILYNNNVDAIVLAKVLKKDNILKNVLYQENLNIINGRFLFGIIIIDCLEYIAKKQNKELNALEITILINDISQQILEQLMIIIEKVSSVHIVTNNVNRFYKFEEKIRDKFGIVIRISNNKRKSLASAKIIINWDFPEEIVNQFKINTTAIILNINSKVKIYTKLFEGIIVQDYKFELNNHIENSNFDEKDIYESIMIKQKNIFEARKKWKNDGGIITNLIGNNGKICEQEYMNFR